jgi:hypothetical protein
VRNGTHTSLRIALCALLVIVASTGCAALSRRSMDVDYDDQRLNDGLAEVMRTGVAARLSDFTSWEWDEVHLFHESTQREFIERTVGSPVIKSDYFGSKASLLVFENDGQPVKAAGIVGDYLRGANHRVSFPADATVQTYGGGFMQLAAP